MRWRLTRIQVSISCQMWESNTRDIFRIPTPLKSFQLLPDLSDCSSTARIGNSTLVRSIGSHPPPLHNAYKARILEGQHGHPRGATVEEEEEYHLDSLRGGKLVLMRENLWPILFCFPFVPSGSPPSGKAVIHHSLIRSL